MNQQNTCDLQYDILENILSRLPVKSLLRLKTVCKSWNAMINDRGFARIHSNRANISNSRRFFGDYFGNGERSLLKFEGHKFHRESVGPMLSEEYEHAVFLCVCEGILVSQNIVRKTVEKKFNLMNPFTRNCMTLPSPHDDETKTSLMTDSRGYGLCLDKYEDDYKFIAVLGGGKFLVYSIKNDTWAERRSECLRRCIVSRQGTYANGVVYWAIKLPVDGILYFDTKDDSMKELRAPEDHSEHEEYDLTILGGDLCLYTVDKKSVMRIWLLKQHGHGWVKLMTVENRVEGAGVPLYYLTGENELVFKNLDAASYVVYYPDKRKFGEVERFPAGKMIIGCPCLESLHFPSVRRQVPSI